MKTEEASIVSGNERLAYMDLTKTITIFLVVLLHGLQFCNEDSPATWQGNRMTIVVLSFHMPLFMIISGFFFQSSLRLSLKELLASKICQLLVPALVWGLASSADLTSWHDTFQGVWGFGWYVKCLFICYLITWSIYKIFSPPAQIAVLTLLNILLYTFPLPTIWLMPKMYVFFCAGIWLRNNSDILTRKKTLVISGLSFLTLLCFWKFEYIMYFRSFYLLPFHDGMWNDLYANTMRIAIGLMGSVFILSAIRQIEICNRAGLLSYIGRYTLGIYLMQELTIVRTTMFGKWLRTFLPDDLAYIIYAVIITATLAATVHFVSKIRILGCILFGMYRPTNRTNR